MVEKMNSKWHQSDKKEEKEGLLRSGNRFQSESRADDPGIEVKQDTRRIDTNESNQKATWQSLPHKRQLLLVALCRLSTPLTNTCLIPYLFFLVKSIVSKPEHPTASQRISRLTGVLVAAFPIGQVLTSMLWGRFSDAYGRKPAILLGLAISVLANIGFGFSRTIGMLVVWRVIAGMANGIEGVMRTMTAEIVKDKKHQPRAFLAPPVVFNSGRVIALAVGGCLADPVDNLPHLFGSKGLFNTAKTAEGVRWALDYPYALPALFNAVVLAFCLVAAAVWLPESLHTKGCSIKSGVVVALKKLVKDKTFQRPVSKYALLPEDEGSNQSLSSPEQSLASCRQHSDSPSIWTRQVCHALVAFTVLPLHNATFLHMFPLLLSMPVVSDRKISAFFFQGGLGLASPTIGLVLAIFGIAGIIIQLFLYPPIHQRIGSVGVFRVASAVFPIVYLAVPYLVLLVDQGIVKWLAISAVLFAQVIARTMAIPSTVLLLTDAVPHRSVLGTVHGAGNTVSAFASACGPALGGLLLAKGIEMGAVGLVWWTWMCVVSIIALIWSFAHQGISNSRSDILTGG